MNPIVAQKTDVKQKSQPLLDQVTELPVSSETDLGHSAGIPLFLQRSAQPPSSQNQPTVQPKLVVGEPNDPYEAEADRVAMIVQSGSTKSLPSSSIKAPNSSIQRKCAQCEASQHPDEEKETLVQAKSSIGASPISPNLSSSNLHLPDSGEPLPERVRTKVEPVLGVDLSHVKVHTSPAAQQTAAALNAKAFTHKHHIWLGPNQSPDDVQLMAHESTHVLQQTESNAPSDIQRQVVATTINDGEEVRQRLQQRLDEALGQRSTKVSSVSRTDHEIIGTASDHLGNRDLQNAQLPLNRSELATKTAELQPEARPSIDRASEQQPQVEQAAQATAASLDQKAQSPLSEPANRTGEKERASGNLDQGAAMEAATAAAGAADQAFALADSQPLPDQPAPLTQPTPVTPVDAGGMPLSDQPEMDAQVFELANHAQNLREQGHNLRSQATEGTANTQILRGNIKLVQQSIGQSEAGVERAQGNLTFRQGLLTQAQQALAMSEQKTVALGEQAPGGVTEAAQGKERSAPLVSESRDLADQSSAQTPDDPEASAQSREQGGKLNQVGTDAATVDNTLTQVHQASNTLVKDAAHATELNTQTREKVDVMAATLDQTKGSLTTMHGHNAQARSQLGTAFDQPSILSSEAANIGTAGQSMIDSSLEIENRLHQAQRNYATGMQKVPAVASPTQVAETADAMPSDTLIGTEGLASETTDFSGEDTLIQRQEADTVPVPPINIAAGLPAWMTGEPEPNAGDRQAAETREIARRQSEIDEIDQMANKAGGFENLGTWDRRGITFRLSMRNTFGGLTNISWPGLGGIARGAGHLAAGLIDPRAPLMGVMSGINMIANGVVNFAQQPSWIGGLRLAATVATGLTIILGSITALAGVIAAIMAAITILSLGTAAPVTGPIIAFCATVMTTVGGWTFWTGLIATALQALTFVADLWQAGTAQTAEQLQHHSETMTEDARNAGNSLLQAGMGRLAQVGGRQMQSAIAESGGGVAFARTMGRGNPLAQAARVSRRVPVDRVGALGRSGVFLRVLGRDTSRGVRGMFRGLRSGIQEAGGIRSFAGRELRQFGRELRTGTPKVFRDRRAFSGEFLVGDGRPVPPGALREGVLGEMQSAGQGLRQVAEGAHPTSTPDVERQVPHDREVPAPQREEGLTDISEAPPESAPTREVSVRDSGHIESDHMTRRQVRNEIEHLTEYPEKIGGAPPNRSARIGEHEWQEQPGGGWCRLSRKVCFNADELRLISRSEADNLIIAATKEEPSVTAALSDVADRNATKMVGLENRLKTAESLSRKIEDRVGSRAAKGQGVSPAVTAEVAKINDTLRYTYRVDGERYMDVYQRTIADLEARGFQHVKSFNSWEQVGTSNEFAYRGINSTFKSSNGQIFELQFHTTETLAMKNELHGLYEEWRMSTTSAARKQEIYNYMLQRWRAVPVPTGAAGSAIGSN